MIVALDSAFWMRKVLFKLTENGIYSIVIPSRKGDIGRVWSDGDAIISHFLIAPVGESHLMMGSYNSVDFKLIRMNEEPKYVSEYIMFSIGSSTVANTDCEEILILQHGSQKF